MIKRALTAVTIGVLATVTFIVFSFAANFFGLTSLANTLFWQDALLQSFMPLNNVGTAAHPIYGGTPLNDLALFASIPLGAVIYGSVAHALLSRTGHRA